MNVLFPTQESDWGVEKGKKNIYSTLETKKKIGRRRRSMSHPAKTYAGTMGSAVHTFESNFLPFEIPNLANTKFKG